MAIGGNALRGVGEVLKEIFISWGVHRALEKEDEKRAHAAASNPAGKGKKGKGAAKAGEGEHPAPPPKATLGTAVSGFKGDFERWLDKVLTDRRELLWSTLSRYTESYKSNIRRHLIEATAGRAPKSENRTVTLLLKSLMRYDVAKKEFALLDEREVGRRILHWNNLTDEQFWQEIDLLHHNPIEQTIEGWGRDAEKSLEDWLTNRKPWWMRDPRRKRKQRNGNETVTNSPDNTGGLS